jgi:DNA (cytosine-5)-methyltransferase 1
LKPYTSVNSVLARIPRNAPNHNIAAATGPGNFVPWDGSGLSPCLMTGSHPCHPSGKGRLTSRQLAAIQTFPRDHVFYGNKTTINAMIGDAVPPAMMKLIFDKIRKHLEDEDGVVHAV